MRSTSHILSFYVSMGIGVVIIPVLVVKMLITITKVNKLHNIAAFLWMCSMTVLLLCR